MDLDYHWPNSISVDFFSMREKSKTQNRFKWFCLSTQPFLSNLALFICREIYPFSFPLGVRVSLSLPLTIVWKCDYLILRRENSYYKNILMAKCLEGGEMFSLHFLFLLHILKWFWRRTKKETIKEQTHFTWTSPFSQF